MTIKENTMLNFSCHTKIVVYILFKVIKNTRIITRKGRFMRLKILSWSN